eukprot:TRINITY_DN67818_c0_g1_i1.p1 TRINITY_DN67818_c0_g1~~TRINITY_DN67818_c0_g1_i1.p1  ORF type:complete len:378 (-),score=29.08 TRINITY_DN67818_c0_g1_i1:5-1117(-)
MKAGGRKQFGYESTAMSPSSEPPWARWNLSSQAPAQRRAHSPKRLDDRAPAARRPQLAPESSPSGAELRHRAEDQYEYDLPEPVEKQRSPSKHDALSMEKALRKRAEESNRVVTKELERLREQISSQEVDSAHLRDQLAETRQEVFDLRRRCTWLQDQLTVSEYKLRHAVEAGIVTRQQSEQLLRYCRGELPTPPDSSVEQPRLRAPREVPMQLSEPTESEAPNTGTEPADSFRDPPTPPVVPTPALPPRTAARSRSAPYRDEPRSESEEAAPAKWPWEEQPLKGGNSRRPPAAYLPPRQGFTNTDQRKPKARSDQYTSEDQPIRPAGGRRSMGNSHAFATDSQGAAWNFDLAPPKARRASAGKYSVKDY